MELFQLLNVDTRFFVNFHRLSALGIFDLRRETGMRVRRKEPRSESKLRDAPYVKRGLCVGDRTLIITINGVSSVVQCAMTLLRVGRGGELTSASISVRLKVLLFFPILVLFQFMCVLCLYPCLFLVFCVANCEPEQHAKVNHHKQLLIKVNSLT